MATRSDPSLQRDGWERDMPGNVTGYAEGVYGVGMREPYESELQYFKANPHVAGMAAEDDKIILNPYSTLKPQEQDAVKLNEAARVHMRRGMIDAPRYALTPEQEKAFAKYGTGNIDDIRQTLAARILSGDPSALTPTPEQQDYVKRLRQFMGVR
jgi:hypothetical protein